MVKYILCNISEISVKGSFLSVFTCFTTFQVLFKAFKRIASRAKRTHSTVKTDNRTGARFEKLLRRKNSRSGGDNMTETSITPKGVDYKKKISEELAFIRQQLKTTGIKTWPSFRAHITKIHRCLHRVESLIEEHMRVAKG